MRQIEFGDINRTLLQSLLLAGQDGTPHSSHVDMHEGLRLSVTAPSQDIVLQELMGRLSYRNRELLGRTFGRLRSYAPEHDAPIDLLSLWADLGRELLEHRYLLCVRAERFEQWRRYFQGLDEDLPAISMLALEDALLAPDVDQAMRHFYQWHTFATGDDRQLVQELRKGVACQHLHLSGSYPAPFYWVGLMNLRFPADELLKQLDAPERRHRYFAIVPPEKLRQQVHLAIALRYVLFLFLEEALRGTAAPEGSREAKQRLLTKLLELGRGDVSRFDARALFESDEVKDMRDRVLRALGGREDRTDYASQLCARGRQWIDSECPSLLGERILLYLLLHHVARERARRSPAPQDFERTLAQAVWVYLQAKNIFLGTIQQREGISGFDYFEHTLRLGPSTGIFAGERNRWAWEVGRFLQESHSVIKAELRVAPPRPERGAEGYDELLDIVSRIQKTMKDYLAKDLEQEHGPPQVGLIIHFIKDKGDFLRDRLSKRGEAAYRIFHCTLRERLAKEVKVLMDYLESPNYESYRSSTGGGMDPVEICGIDTANRELYCPPELFGCTYERFARYALGRTFHVGEDFIHMTTGLRRIYEAIFFLKLAAGDRLGHCVALGMSPKLWVHANPMVSIHRLDLLDDAIFEWVLLQKHAVGDLLRLAELERRIAHHSMKIYGRPIDPYTLQAAWERRAQDFKGRDDVFDPGEQIPRWVVMQGLIMRQAEKLIGQRGDPSFGGTHNVIPSVSDLAQVARAYRLEEKVDKEHWPGEVGPESWPKDLAARLLDEYLYDKHTIDRALEQEMVQTLPELEHILRIQEILRKVIMSTGLTVESNPSSNWLIGGFERLYDVPAVRWALHHRDFPMTLSPDDPVTFSTSIENEYFFVFSCLMKGTDEAPPLSRLEALERIRKIREQGLESSFLQKTPGRRLPPRPQPAVPAEEPGYFPAVH